MVHLCYKHNEESKGHAPPLSAPVVTSTNQVLAVFGQMMKSQLKDVLGVVRALLKLQASTDASYNLNVISVHFSPARCDQIRHRAWAKGTTVSDVVRDALG